MNSYGKLFRISIFGESHGEKVGVVIDGMRAGIKVDEDIINQALERRKPNYVGSTPRKESDTYIIESGVYNGFTTGTPILVSVENKNIIKKDYDEFVFHNRPSHVDFVSKVKYKGYNNLPGSGHFSGRLTVALVIAGAFAKMMVNYEVKTEIIKVGKLDDLSKLDEYIKKVKDENDSAGAVIKLTVKNVEAGLGEPFFSSVESRLSHILYSVPGVKGVSFGVGFKGVRMLGSEFNDLIINEKGETLTNNNGGINGGITNGNDLVVNVFIRPAASIAKSQKTFNFKTKKIEELTIKGRHDSFIAQRALVVLESAVLIGLVDLWLEKRSRE